MTRSHPPSADQEPGREPATVTMTLNPASPHFDRPRYRAPADEEFTLKITNLIVTTTGRPLQATVLISPSHHPAIQPVPGLPGFGTIISTRATFIAPTITAPETEVSTVGPLAAGTYGLQLQEYGFGSGATLVVGN